LSGSTSQVLVFLELDNCSHVKSIAKNFVWCKIKSGWLWFWFLGKESGASRFLPTKRAADFWESAASRSIFLASGFFYTSSLFLTRPKSANANR
jgi:hypothetical protein